jgi:hypothetical protein
MCTIQTIRTDILKKLSEKYSSTSEELIMASDQDIENAHFLLENHAGAVRKVCKRHSYSISFRNAGEYTLRRIQDGHPCKGHHILDKSIKKSDAGWTYSPVTADMEPVTDTASVDRILSPLAGLIGYKVGEGNALGGLWKFNGSTAQRIPYDVGMTEDETFHTFYTGDYDMHDLLFYRDDKYCRIVADTPDEHSAIDYFNSKMVQKGGDTQREKTVLDCIIKNGQRSTTSDYSLIRHGAQTSYMCYLHGITGSRELKEFIERNVTKPPKKYEKIPNIPKMLFFNNIIKIDPNICMFDKDGNAYILNTLPKIYQYYRKYKLLNMIPFYYFFDDLNEGEFKSKIEQYSQIINEYLIKCYGE